MSLCDGTYNGQCGGVGIDVKVGIQRPDIRSVGDVDEILIVARPSWIWICLCCIYGHTTEVFFIKNYFLEVNYF